MRYRPAFAVLVFAIASAAFAQTNGNAATRDLAQLSLHSAHDPDCIPGARCSIPLVHSHAPLQPFVPASPNTASPIDTDCRMLPTQIERDHCVSQKLHTL